MYTVVGKCHCCGDEVELDTLANLEEFKEKYGFMPTEDEYVAVCNECYESTEEEEGETQ